MTVLVFFEVCLFTDKYLRINFQIFVLVVPAILMKWVELMISKVQRNSRIGSKSCPRFLVTELTMNDSLYWTLPSITGIVYI